VETVDNRCRDLRECEDRDVDGPPWCAHGRNVRIVADPA
jgi:hypothetical protein